MRISTLPVNIQTLPQTDDTILMFRVAMAANDLASGDFLLHQARQIDNPRLSELREGTGMYAVRLMISHLREAMWIIDDVNKAERDSNSQIKRLISGLGTKFQEQYALLLRCLPGGVDEAVFKKRIHAIRNILTFHYKPATSAAIQQALSDMAHSLKRPIHNIVEGENVRTSRLALADAVVDRVACRILLNADTADVPDVRAAVDEKIAWCMERALAFHDFGFALCLAYFGQYSAA